MVDLDELRRLDQLACGGLLPDRERARKEILFFTGDIIIELTALRAKAAAGEALRKTVGLAVAYDQNPENATIVALAEYDAAVGVE